MIFSYVANIPQRSFKSTPSESANINQLMEKLKETQLLDHYKCLNSSKASQQPLGSDSSSDGQLQIDIKNGIFAAHNDDQHKALMEQLDHLSKFGLLEEVFESTAEVNSAATNDQHRANITSEPNNRSHAEQLVHDDAVKKMMAEIKTKYTSGYPLTLSQAFKQHCQFRGQEASPDERSRLNCLIEFMGDLNLHELTSDHFANYKSSKTNADNGEKCLSIRTVDERIALVRYMIHRLKVEGIYRGENPLEHWKRAKSSTWVKNAAAGKFASITTITNVYGSDEFKVFGINNPAYYLVTTIAVVTGMRISSICGLKAKNFITTEDGIHAIELFRRSKTNAGKRQIPLPTELFEASKKFLKKNQDSFGFTQRIGKGYADSFKDVSDQFFKDHEEFDPELLNPHGLRAALNQHLLKSGVQLDVRCAFMGHSMSHVNSKYMSGVPTDIVHRNIQLIQEKLLVGLRFDPSIPAALKRGSDLTYRKPTTHTPSFAPSVSGAQIQVITPMSIPSNSSNTYQLMIDPTKPNVWKLV